MKRYTLFPLITLILLATTLWSCSSSPLEKAVKQALVQQDTTQERFDSICSIIKAYPE